MNVRIHPAERLQGTVDPPSSKNYTTRYLLVSCLADGKSRVVRPAVSEDAVAMVECAETLGARVATFDAKGIPIAFSLENADRIDSVAVIGFGTAPALTRPDGKLDPDPEHPTVDVNPHNAGAVMRMLLGAAALLPAVRFVTDHPDSLGKRPNRDLLEAFDQLGVEWEAKGEEGLLPISMYGGWKRIRVALDALARERADGGPPRIRVSGAVSSQYVSSILFLAPLLRRSVDIEVMNGLRSRPLVETTVEVMRQAGIDVEHAENCMEFRIAAGAGYQSRTWNVNGDWPGSAALLAAAAAVPGSGITVERLHNDLQGERHVLDILEQMGCATTRTFDSERHIPVVSLNTPSRNDPLNAVEIDGDRCTDAVLALYAAAALAEGTTKIHGIRNLQFKECDRIRDPLTELRRIYATRPEFQDSDGTPNEGLLARSIRWNPENDPEEVAIEGRPDGFEGGIEVDGHGDHRVVMMLSIVGLRCRKGLTIRGAEAVAKSYPKWFEDLTALGVKLDRLRD